MNAIIYIRMVRVEPHTSTNSNNSATDKKDLKMTKLPLIVAVLFACIQIAPVMLIFSFIVGISHFGYISGPRANALSWMSYFLFTVPPLAVFAANRIKSSIDKRTINHITFLKSLIVVLPAILTIHATETIITLYQFGGDEEVFITGILFALVSLISLSYLFVSPSRDESLKTTPINYGKLKTWIWIALITISLLILSSITWVKLIELLSYVEFADKITNNLSHLISFPFPQVFLLPFFLILAIYLTPKLSNGPQGFRLTLKTITVLLIHFGFIIYALTYFSPKTIFRNAESYLQWQYYGDAVFNYETILRYYPKFAATTPDFNNKLNEAQKLEAQAYKEGLEEKLKLDPENLNVYKDLGRAYWKDKELNKAIDTFKKGLELDLTSKNPEDVSRVYENLGEAYYDNDQLDEAIDALKKAVDYDPENAYAYVYLGLTYEKKGDTEEAVKHYQTALQLYPNNETAKENLKRLQEKSKEEL